MAVAKDKVIISVTIDKDVRDLLVRVSKDHDLTLSKFSKNLIYVALGDLQLLDKVGIVAVAAKYVSFIENNVTHKGLRDFLIVHIDKSPVTISVVIDSSTKKILDKYSAELGLPLNIFARNLIYVGLDSYKFLELVGLVKLSKLASAFSVFIKAYIKDTREE